MFLLCFVCRFMPVCRGPLSIQPFYLRDIVAVCWRYTRAICALYNQYVGVIELLPRLDKFRAKVLLFEQTGKGFADYFAK